MIYPCLRPSSKDIYVVFISSPGNSVFKIEKNNYQNSSQS